MTPLRPEVYGAPSLARKHAELAYYPSLRPRWRARLRCRKHASKVQKLVARARRLGWDGPSDPAEALSCPGS